INGASYQWSGPQNFTSSLRNPVISNATVGFAGQYSVTITHNGCSKAFTTPTSIHPLPNANFSYSPLNATVSSPSTFSPNYLSYPSYAWAFSNSTLGTSSATSPVVNWSATGNANASLTVIDSNGCQNTSQQTLSIGTCPSGSQTFSYTGNVQTF